MQKPIPLIAGNWKMYKTVPEAVEAAKRLVYTSGNYADTEILIAPPFISLFPVFEVIKSSRILLGAQNVFWEKEGAFTGEISASMLRSAGCRYGIVGHSERRQYFGETDETVNKRIRSLFQENLTPIFCIGETESQRESGNTFSVLDKQIRIGLKDMVLNRPDALVIAYEPVWAIGTGKTATATQAQEVHQFIRKMLEPMFGIQTTARIRILYGGSVKPENISELMSMPDINGALVGGASL
ncbi:MAG: triose-phosphate isomerase, partial [Thermodesulfobacteriota bacterium]